MATSYSYFNKSDSGDLVIATYQSGSTQPESQITLDSRMQTDLLQFLLRKATVEVK